VCTEVDWRALLASTERTLCLCVRARGS
jgi:hypothetical protein